MWRNKHLKNPETYPFSCGHCGQTKMNRTKTGMEGGQHNFYHRFVVPIAFSLIITKDSLLSSAGPMCESGMKFLRLLAIFTTFLVTCYVILSYSTFYVLLFIYFSCDL